MSERPILVVRGLKKAFRENIVLNDFNLELYKGENVAVLGRSGSGKSVLIKCIIGLLPCDKGSIEVFGQNIPELNSEELDRIRTKVGFLFQSNALYDSMTVRKNLEFPLRRHWMAVGQDEMNERVINDMAVIAENLKSTILRLNKSTAIWQLLNDSSLPVNAQSSMANIRLATAQARETVRQIQMLVTNVKKGNGTLGVLLNDTSLAQNLSETVAKVKMASNHADSFVLHINEITESIQNDLDNGKGTISAILKDSTLIIKLHHSLDNIEMGTAAFNENMKALQSNFLLKGYFRKQQKQFSPIKNFSTKNNE